MASRITTRKPAAARPDGRPQTRTPQAGSVSAEQIRQRAFELYKARGGINGDEISDWLQAERELAGSAKSLKGS